MHCVCVRKVILVASFKGEKEGVMIPKFPPVKEKEGERVVRIVPVSSILFT
jgi:hypothetical protein